MNCIIAYMIKIKGVNFMNKNVMKKWVKALRSGKYKQGQRVLKQTNGEGKTSHCCLGVLCELYNDQMRKNKKKTLSEKIQHGIHYINKCDEKLPEIVKEWAGLYNDIGSFKDSPESFEYYNGLSDMNDLGCSFKKIATIIEKQWENL